MHHTSADSHGLMIEGPIAKQLILFSLPLLLGNLFQQLYNAVDSAVVGNYVGMQALAAVGASGPVINLLVSFFMGISIGAGVVISHYYGAKNHERVQDSVHTTMALCLLAGVLMTVIGIVLSPYILEWIATPKDVITESITYLRIYFLGILAVMVYNMGSGILRAVGDSRHPLYFLIVSSVSNIILDLLLVIVFQMGIAGVGWATLISQCISAVLVMRLLMKTQEAYRISIAKLRVHKDLLLEIVRLGIPSGIQNAVVSFSNIIVQSNINAFGSIAMAGCAAYTKIDGFAILPVMSYSMALTTFIGQNMGAKEYDRVKRGSRIGILLSAGTISVISSFLLIFGRQLLSIFSNDPNVIEYGLYMMRILAPGYILLATTHALNGIIRGAGITTVPMIVMISCWCVMRMTWITITVPIFQDIATVFAGWPITWFASSLIFLIYYFKGNWIKKER